MLGRPTADPPKNHEPTESRDHIMSMKTLSSPRRVYTRNGSQLVCFAGYYFGPGRGASEIDASKQVRIEVLPRSHGKGRIAVTQGTGDAKVVENWTEQSIVFEKRS